MFFLCYNSIDLVHCILCHSKNDLQHFPMLYHGLGSCMGSCTTALPAPEVWMEPGAAQPWISLNSWVQLLSDSSLLAGGI